MHIDVLCFHCPGFKAKLEKDGHIALSDVDPRLFEIVAQWCYINELPEGNAHDTSSSTGKICTRILCELWVFGKKFNMRQLQNDMVTKIVERVMVSHWSDTTYFCIFADSSLHFTSTVPGKTQTCT